MIHTTTYVHMHDGDEITVADGAPVSDSESGALRTSIDFGSTANVQVTVFLDVTMAQELARSILAAYPLPGPRALSSGELAALRKEVTNGPRELTWLGAPTLITVVDHTHQCRDCRAEVDCDGDPCVFDGSCDACS